MLDDKEKRHIFNVCLYAPYEAEGDVQEGRRGLYVMHEKLDFSRTIIGEEHAEAGSMAISVCGSPTFENALRKAVIKSKDEIYFTNVGIHASDTDLSTEFEDRFTEGVYNSQDIELKVRQRGTRPVASGPARAPKEQRRREKAERAQKEAERKRDDAEEQTQKTTLPEYLHTCHTHLSLGFTVQTDASRSTQGDPSNAQRKLRPRHLRPWAEFEEQQSSIWTTLCDSIFLQTRQYTCL
ncbi:hypothetical protein EJ05DRAFT_505911 [Pseudovirgaria hyperparasitica]|uniref:Uncharacterized protein n=1 Tax=Pseudovirgaria hyperparasitica TaxID=470096 RepID=A0A6A6VQW8_9PEZI|nr:uncharacterized protein EJ05DRAFT_505911 [Pseudovirgaria hyperparasitica]KAF2752593.1 hypothetical protein EJ05DRAFT_505911 [Pseudovirgaria hyperparasitica]